jgi:putative tryptophan/tyrosine transport system substrate-binding protein
MERRRSHLSRRRFVAGAGVAGLGLVAGCRRLPWQVSPPAKVPRIGFLAAGPPTIVAPLAQAFLQGLSGFGYTEGQNITIDYRYPAGPEQTRAFADELVRLPVDIIVAGTQPAAEAAQAATTTIPIVTATVADPIGSGLITSLAHPGGNVTGVTSYSASSPLSGKRLQLLKEAVPSIARPAVLWNPTDSGLLPEWRATASGAEVLGVQPLSLEVRQAHDFDRAFEVAVDEHADALICLGAPLVFTEMNRIVGFANQTGLPGMYPWREAVLAGGLMAYGTSVTANYRRAAYFVDRILRGTKPADLPVEQPMTFEFVVNMMTAQALGITFPNETMLQVTEVIQ